MSTQQNASLTFHLCIYKPQSPQDASEKAVDDTTVSDTLLKSAKTSEAQVTPLTDLRITKEQNENENKNKNNFYFVLRHCDPSP
jgi:hypothetical protein